MDSSVVTVTTNTRTYFHSGTRSLSFGPWRDYGFLFLTVLSGAPVKYRRDQIQGVRFWISAGADVLDPEDLAVAVVGSNDYPYYIKGDHSVEPLTVGQPTFSETRLSYLGLNRAIPAGQWAEITIWLDDLQFDPDYTYITGIYLKNDAGVRSTFFIDELTFISYP